jgi:hypothetical protein
VGGLCRHAEWPQMADAVLAAALHSSLRLAASHDHACTRTNDKACLPEPSVTNVRNMLDSCDNHARNEKRNGEMFRCHAEWPQVADAVIEASPSTRCKGFYQEYLLETSPLRHAAYHSIV